MDRHSCAFIILDVLARTLGTQLDAGEDYQHLRASVGLHLLDFDLFTSTENERRQAVLCHMNRIRELSADEEARRLANVREKALRDEVSFLNDARREGREEVARNLITMDLLTDVQIADASGLTEHEVKVLREDLKH